MTTHPLTIACIYLHDYVRTGGHRRYLELVEGLAARGNRCLLFASPVLDPRLPGVQTVLLPVKPGRRLLPKSVRYAAAIRRALRTGVIDPSSADVVMVHGESHFFPARVVARICRCPLFFAFRSLPVVVGAMAKQEPGVTLGDRFRISLRVTKYRWYERLIGRRADRIGFQSPFDQESYLSRVPAARSRCVVIRGNIGEPWFVPAARDTNASTSCRRIVYVGGVGERKGVRYLLDAFVSLAVELPDLTLRVIGDGAQLAQLRQTAARAGLSDRVLLEGRVADPLPMIADADLMVVPSLFDSYPDTVLEALHVGTPVIASRVGGIPDMLEHEELLFPPADAPAIADRIRLLATDAAAYRRVRDLCSGRRSYFEFDWPEEWERVMREVVGQGSRER